MRQHNRHQRTQHKWSSPLSPHISAPGVFWCAWTIFAAVSHTSDHLEEQSRSSPQPLYLCIREPSARSHWDQREEENTRSGFSGPWHTWTTQGSCVRAVVHLFSFYVLLRYSIFAHGSFKWLSVCCFVHTQWSCQNVIHHCWLVFLAS